MNKFIISTGLISAALLSACDNSQVVKDENSQFYSVSPGSTFTLNREVTIQPDNTSIYLQNGKIELAKNVDFYKPNCKFELYTISEQARQVKPDTFVVTKVVDQSEDVSAKWPTYAGLGMALGDGPVHLTFSSMFCKFLYYRRGAEAQRSG